MLTDLKILSKFGKYDRIRRIHQNCCFDSTPLLTSFALWQNFVKFVILAASSVPLSQAHSLFGETSSKLPFPSNLWQNFIKFAIFVIACISEHISKFKQANNRH